MGFKIEFNYVLKLKPENGLVEENLKEGDIYNFVKNDYRIYPLDQPIDLINRNWEVLAWVIVIEVFCADNKTLGKYQVEKIYNKEEKFFLTKYWRERVEIKQGQKIESFFDVKVT